MDNDITGILQRYGYSEGVPDDEMVGTDTRLFVCSQHGPAMPMVVVDEQLKQIELVYAYSDEGLSVEIPVSAAEMASWLAIDALLAPYGYEYTWYDDDERGRSWASTQDHLPDYIHESRDGDVVVFSLADSEDTPGYTCAGIEQLKAQLEGRRNEWNS